MKGFVYAMQKTARCLLAISLSISSAAVAAKPLNWQGPYVGAHFITAFANSHASTNVGAVTGSSYFTTAADVNAVNSSGTGSENTSAFGLGVLAGHDWIWQQLVYGVVMDYTKLPLTSSESSSATYPDTVGTYSIETTTNTNWLFTLRGRLGYQAMWRWPSLLYVTAGAAVTQLKVNNTFTDTSALAGVGGNSNSENQIGWVAGVGIELASFDRTTVDFEYLYLHLPAVKTESMISNSQGGFGVPAQSLNSTFSTSGQLHANIFSIGVNYRFDE
jgi:opacity protein-like surface antigen